jgi:hypothetical protein
MYREELEKGASVYEITILELSMPDGEEGVGALVHTDHRLHLVGRKHVCKHVVLVGVHQREGDVVPLITLHSVDPAHTRLLSHAVLYFLDVRGVHLHHKHDLIFDETFASKDGNVREGLVRDDCQRGVVTGIEGADEREVEQALVVVTSDYNVFMKRHHLYVLYLQKSDNRAIHVDFGINWFLVLTCTYLRNLHLI